MKHYVLLAVLAVVVAIVVFLIVQFLVIRFNGSPVAVPDIPRGVQTTGVGKPLSYVIMGDSTSISQGSKYEEGFVFASVAHLARAFAVKAVNTGISGATTEDVRRDQLSQAVGLRPDIVLLAVGGNDVTHLVRSEDIRKSVQGIIDELQKANPNVRIVVTSSPAMDSVTRFPDGAKQLLGHRTRQVNAVFAELIKKNDLISAPIAEKTRDAFIADPTLTAADNFHPNARGYALWIPIINQALDIAVKK